MTKFEIRYNRNGCIGAFTCVEQGPFFFEEGEDGKANLLLSKEENGEFVRVIECSLTDNQIKEALQAAEVCPVRVIKIKNLDTGEVLI